MVMSMRNRPVTARLPQWIASAALGGGIWVAWALAVRPEWTAVLLLLSPFVLLPLGLRLAARVDTGPEAPALRTLAQLAPALAMTAAASFLPGPGLLAALLSVPWLAFTVAVALVGVGRLLVSPNPRRSGDWGRRRARVRGYWRSMVDDQPCRPEPARIQRRHRPADRRPLPLRRVRAPDRCRVHRRPPQPFSPDTSRRHHRRPTHRDRHHGRWVARMVRRHGHGAGRNRHRRAPPEARHGPGRPGRGADRHGRCRADGRNEPGARMGVVDPLRVARSRARVHGRNPRFAQRPRIRASRPPRTQHARRNREPRSRRNEHAPRTAAHRNAATARRTRRQSRDHERPPTAQ